VRALGSTSTATAPSRCAARPRRAPGPRSRSR
jgi:hypothetical protein